MHRVCLKYMKTVFELPEIRLKDSCPLMEGCHVIVYVGFGPGI